MLKHYLVLDHNAETPSESKPSASTLKAYVRSSEIDIVLSVEKPKS